MPNLHRYLLTIEFCTVPVFTARTMQYDSERQQMRNAQYKNIAG